VGLSRRVLALAVSLEDLAAKTNNSKAKVLAESLNEAIGKHLEHRKAPSIKVNEIDNRGSNFYLALYWADALSKRDSSFKSLAEKLKANEAQIAKELIECQGKPIDIGGYWRPADAKCNASMRASQTFNKILDE